MASDDRRKEPKSVQVARLPMTHSACGGKADLVVLLSLGKLTFKIFCHRCEYTEWWTGTPTEKEKPA